MDDLEERAADYAGRVGGLEWEIVYANAKNEDSERRITVRDVYTRGGHLYLKAVCHAASAVRAFRTDRILEATDLETGEIYEDEEVDAAFFALGRQIDPDLLPPLPPPQKKQSSKDRDDAYLDRALRGEEDGAYVFSMTAELQPDGRIKSVTKSKTPEGEKETVSFGKDSVFKRKPPLADRVEKEALDICAYIVGFIGVILLFVAAGEFIKSGGGLNLFIYGGLLVLWPWDRLFRKKTD